MNVGELITLLQEYPMHARVCVNDVDPDFKVELFCDLEGVEKITDSRGAVIVLLTMEDV